MKINSTIIIIHNNQYVKNVVTLNCNIDFNYTNRLLTEYIFEIAANYPNHYIGWCHESLVEHAHLNNWIQLIDNPYQILSYHINSQHIDNRIGYVEFSSPFIIKKSAQVRTPNWFTSSQCGIMYGGVLRQFDKYQNITTDFDLVLSAISRNGTRAGLFSYSEPNLLTSLPKSMPEKQSNMVGTIQLVKSFNGLQWVLYMLICLLVFEKKFNPIWLLAAFLKKKFPRIQLNHEQINIENKSIDIEANKIEVIIPTLGRAKYVEDVLNDLAAQTLLPHVVTIIEQKPLNDPITDLTFLKNTNYPFSINHQIIHQFGACNARNIAIKNLHDVKWVFFADDDIRLEKDTLKNAIQTCLNYTFSAITMCVYQAKDKPTRSSIPIQWGTFGSGCSIVSKAFAASVYFDKNLEFGYGEDADYGISLRKKGCDIAYIASNPILHLKAPIGGFRVKFEHPWKDAPIQPKPSPTVMYNHLKNYEKFQVNGYKLFLIIRQVLSHKKLNLNHLLIQWEISKRYAEKMLT